MNIIKLTTLFATFSIFSIFGQEHLEPVNGFYDAFDFQFEYHSKIRNILFKGLAEGPIIRFVVIPSFTKEQVLDIERDEMKYYLIVHEVDKPIWGNYELDKIKVNEYRKELDSASVEIIHKLFHNALKQTRYPDRNTQGTDGANYYFSTLGDFQILSGTIWSPKNGTKLDKLVDISYDLIFFTKRENQASLKQKLLDRISTLTEEFK